jgi:hypothetical protein
MANAHDVFSENRRAGFAAASVSRAYSITFRLVSAVASELPPTQIV